jgi:hypothetical protein
LNRYHFNFNKKSLSLRKRYLKQVKKLIFKFPLVVEQSGMTKFYNKIFHIQIPQLMPT